MKNLRLAAILPIVEDQVTCAGETFDAFDVLAKDPEVYPYFVGALGGDETGLPWPGEECAPDGFGFRVDMALTSEDGEEALLVVVTFDIDAEAYLDGFRGVLPLRF